MEISKKGGGFSPQNAPSLQVKQKSPLMGQASLPGRPLTPTRMRNGMIANGGAQVKRARKGFSPAGAGSGFFGSNSGQQAQMSQSSPSLGNAGSPSQGEQYIHRVSLEGVGLDGKKYVAEFDAVFPSGTEIIDLKHGPA